MQNLELNMYKKNGLLKRLSLLISALFFTVLSSLSAANTVAENSPLVTFLGPRAANYIFSQLSESEWRYLELLAIRTKIFDSLTNQGEYLAPWDQRYATQNNLLNILSEMRPTAEQALDSTELLNEQDLESELRQMADDDLTALGEEYFSIYQGLQNGLWDLALPSVSNEVIIEVAPADIYAASSLATGSIAKFYENLANHNGWEIEWLSSKEDTKTSGVLIAGSERLHHAFLKIKGPQVYRKLFLEVGVHRIIFRDDHLHGATTRGGATHTNYTSVKVYPRPKRDSFVFKNTDVKFQFIRSTGAGGQHVNTTDSAVRATHVPSGIAILVQRERSQHENRRVALQTLEAILFTKHLEKQKARMENIRNQSQGLSLDTTTPFTRVYNFVRDPIESEALLSGVVRPESFNLSETFLDLKLAEMSEELAQEIQFLENQFPHLQREFSYRVTSSPAPMTCRALLN